MEIRQGDAVRIRASQFPVPTVCLHDTTTDWFGSLGRCLNWNVREPQKSMASSDTDTGESGLGPLPRTGLSRGGTTSRPESLIL